MRWWAHSRLRTKIFLAFSVLILALLLLTLGFVQLAVSRQVQSTLKEELLTTGHVFQGLVTERGTRLLTNTILLAGDFALKRAIATYDPSTLASVALNYQGRVGVDLLWIADEAGVLLADSRGRQQSGRELATFSPVAEALTSGEASATIAEIEGILFQLVAVPVLGPDVIGFLLLGKAIDDPVAQQLQEDTGSHISFLGVDDTLAQQLQKGTGSHVSLLTHGKLFASSWSQREREIFFLRGQAVPELLQQGQGDTFLLTLARERFLSILVPISSHLSLPLYALVQRSYDEALAPLYALRQRIAGIGVGALVVALFLGVGLARGITSPVQTLVVSMQEVIRGNLRHRIQVTREDEIGFLAHSFNEMAGGLEEREQIKDTFGRFVSRGVAEAVLSGRVPLAGERREVSILFQDIRGFTTISEKTEPEALVRLLNQFFTEMVAAVEAEGGVVKQFTGDGVMALFGAPVAHPDDPERAVRAALGMVSRLAGLNLRLRSQGVPALHIGVGIHTGEVVAGRIGPDERVEYAVVGDPVNLASRIEGLTKELQATILVSTETAARLGPGFTLGRAAVLPVKGKEQPVEVVEVLSYGPTADFRSGTDP